MGAKPVMKPKALILHATGTNRDLEAAQALELAGAQAEIVHLNQLRHKERSWADYQILVLPGGFSYADALSAGRLLALDLTAYFADEVRLFVESGNPIIGICNGFQALVKSGILPGRKPAGVTGGANAGRKTLQATLTFNASGHFECRWVTLKPFSQTCLWTRGLAELIYCPVAHGEGRFVLADETAASSPSDAGLQKSDQIALLYTLADGTPAGGSYPENPNGSFADIAGVCNPQGNVLGLMPHPEDHIFDIQHPRWGRGESGCLGLPLFENGVRYVR
jgi:phosphoribosylformylglycinamidine synthase subunit PurQ / glutaminase